MSAVTPVAGYPPHRVVTFCRWANPHGVRFTDWGAACGALGTTTGHQPFGLAGNARRKELCKQCFPSGHFGDWPDPVEVPADLQADQPT